MSIKRLLNDVFERVEFLDKRVDNPFLRTNKNSEEFSQYTQNPFADFFSGTYVWIESPDEKQ